jgi:hypothetical protein
MRILGWLLPATVALAACSGASTDPLLQPQPPGETETARPPATVTAPTPSTPPQSSFNGAGAGCSNVFAYRATSDRTQFIFVQADRDKLGLAVGGKRTLDLAADTTGVLVGIDVWTSAPRGEAYCTDYIEGRAAGKNALERRGRPPRDRARRRSERDDREPRLSRDHPARGRALRRP